MHAVIAAMISLAFLIATIGGAAAQEKETEDFLGFTIESNRLPYVVTRDVNVRAKPETSSKRIDGLKEGQKVVARGRHQGWIAIERDGAPYGFAYFKYLVPFIDGKLDAPITGETTVKQGSCSYEIVFDGKTRPEGEVFEFSDYTVSLNCEIDGEAIAFELLAFMTEGPYARNKDSIHQIGIDLLSVAKDFDHVLSSIVLYDHLKGEAVFDQVTLKDYARKPETTALPAADVPAALDAAVKITLEAWNEKVWEELADASG